MTVLTLGTMHQGDPLPLVPLGPRRLVALRPATTLALASAAMGAALLVASVVLPGPAPAALVLFAAVVALALRGLLQHWPHGRLGPANVVTLGRAALAAALVPAILVPADYTGADPGAGWTLFGLALATLALDGIDGRLARRSGLAGGFGARFDMEVDAFFAALLSVAALRLGLAGPEVLALGFMRYAFALAMLALPWLAAPLPESLRRKAVCVVQIGTLVVILCPWIGPPLSAWLAAGATALLIWSFALDIRALARRR